MGSCSVPGYPERNFRLIFKGTENGFQDIISLIQVLPGSSTGKGSACNVGDPSLIPGEGGNRTGSILKTGLHLGPDCGLRAICPVSMETIYQLENQAPGMKSPRALHHLKEYPNYLCDPIESYILLCLLGNDHKPIDNCPLLTT